MGLIFHWDDDEKPKEKETGFLNHFEDNEKDEYESMGFLGGSFRNGHWTLSSNKDPRWNASGYGIVGGLVMPPDAEKVLERMKKQYKCEPPDDLEFSYMKD